MGKSVYIAEKPSVAQEFAKALKIEYKTKRRISGGGQCNRNMVCWTPCHDELSRSI